MKTIFFFSIGCLCLLLTGCHQKNSVSQTDVEVIFDAGYYPYCIQWKDKYYYTMQVPSADSIIIYASDNPSRLASGERRLVWYSKDMQHIWSPELHRMDNKWYLYFEADGGNTDDHQLYVLENDSDDPMKGEYRFKGAIKTNEEWNFGLHPTSIVVHGQQYLLWSGWQHRRSETETQCIYIARMKNPWTLDSERVLISQPELEWERQWINPNGDRSNYPIFVNENPEAFISPDGNHVCVCYSASGIWTVYHALGMLYSRADADLLLPSSWTKVQEPLFVSEDRENLYGTSNISVVTTPDGKQHIMLYEANRLLGDEWHRSVMMQYITWDKNGLPVFGKPVMEYQGPEL
ncbi:MAG: glycoside hydrolase family 43 protein [Prevotella sp.]|nr:glycoside hydrolase family 43 protein [Prevotella sp.]